MADHAVGRDGFRGLRQQHGLLRHAPSAGGARLGINDDAAGLDQALLEERQQGQQAGGGEATRSSNKLRVSDGRAVPFRQAVDGTAAEFSVLTVEGAGLLGVHLQPLLQGAVAEVGGEVHHPHTPLQQLQCQLTGQAVGEAQNSKIGTGRNPIRIR